MLILADEANKARSRRAVSSSARYRIMSRTLDGSFGTELSHFGAKGDVNFTMSLL